MFVSPTWKDWMIAPTGRNWKGAEDMLDFVLLFGVADFLLLDGMDGSSWSMMRKERGVRSTIYT